MLIDCCVVFYPCRPDNILLVENQNVIDGGLAHAIAKLADFGLHVVSTAAGRHRRCLARHTLHAHAERKQHFEDRF